MEYGMVKGTCLLMCPEPEIEMRSREGIVHVLETRQGKTSCKERLTADRRKMVKMFSRSAAGKDMLCPDLLRPPPILRKTTNYLLSTVVSESQVHWSAVCVFVTDRLRSVRQDMIIQQTPPHVSSAILEPVVRFHAYSAYRLCEEPVDVFDPHLNGTHLNESLKQLLVCYDSAQSNKSCCESNDSWGRLSAARDQMEALYGILHLGNVDALYRMLSLTPHRESLLSVALRMSLAHFRNDYITVCRLMRCLPTLLACVAAQHLPYVRRKALSIMNNAYSSKNLRYPLDQLSKVLAYSNDTEAAEDCRHYGLTVQDTGVHFLKGSFDFSVKECKPKRLPFIEDSLAKMSLPELLLTASEPNS